MPKRKTKAQREQEQRNELYVRISDMAAGACGRRMDCDEEFFVPEDLARLIPVLRETYGVDRDEEAGTYSNQHLFRPHNLNYYTDLQSLVDFFFEHGVRG